MANNSNNLRPPTAEEARERGRKGGKASATVDRLKYVRQGFIQAVMESGSHWQSRPIIPNLLKDGNIYGGF